MVNPLLAVDFRSSPNHDAYHQGDYLAHKTATEGNLRKMS